METKRVRRRDRVREDLLARAIPIPKEQHREYTPISAIARLLNRDPEPVHYEISQSDVPVYMYSVHEKPVFCLTLADAETYSQTPIEPPPLREPINKVHVKGRKPIPIGTASRCGVCGTTSGNILAHRDAHERIRVYMCATCTRIVKDLKGDPKRMRAAAKVIEALGNERLHF